jgi:hypothetical protein
MTIRETLRNRFAAGDGSGGAPQSAGGEAAEAAEDHPLPFGGYDALSEKDVIRALHEHSQLELEAAENYERSHRNRLVVLDKLRFMRQREPLSGYDALSSDEIVSVLERADLATIKKVRGYERKFTGRAAVLEAVTRVHRERRAAKPAAAPGYQPMSASP